MSVQLEGIIMIGATDRSAEISSFVIEVTRRVVTTMATYADATENDKAGPQKASVTIRAKNTGAAAALARQLYTAILTDSAELAFIAQHKTGVIGADNPAWTGNLVVTGVTLGTGVGDEMVMEQTFPVNSLALDVTP